MRISIETKRFNYDRELGITIKMDGEYFAPAMRCLSPDPQNVGASDDPRVVAAALRKLADALDAYEYPGRRAGDVVSAGIYHKLARQA